MMSDFNVSRRVGEVQAFRCASRWATRPAGRERAASRTRLTFELLEQRHLLDAVPLLPDLVPWDQEFRGYNYDWYLDTQELPGRTLMRFSTASVNIGPQVGWIRAPPGRS